jgi:anti-anti-sigma factor
MLPYTIQQNSNRIIVAPTGELFGFEASKFEQDILARTGTGTTIIFDLHELRFIDSMGIGLLLRVKKHTETRGGSLSVKNPARVISSIFSRYKLTEMFQVSDSSIPPQHYSSMGGQQHARTAQQRIAC